MLKRYPVRVLRYFLFLTAVFVVVIGLLAIFDYVSWDALKAIGRGEEGTRRLWFLLIVFVGLPLVYPLVSYGSREIRGNFGERRAVIDRALETSGYHIDEESEGRIVARATGSRRFTLLMVENRVEITADSDRYVRIEGPKKEIVRIEYRIRAFANL